MNVGRFKPLLINLGERLKDPLQLRIAITAVILAGWYFGIYEPIDAGISTAMKARTSIAAHTVLARDIEALRNEVDKLGPRLPTGTDTNEWVEYFLGSIREYPVRLLKLEPMGTKKHGPFTVITLRIELSGQYDDLIKMLEWIESNKRLLRVDAVGIDPSRLGAGSITLKLTVLGIMG
jgi:Tfp pilus assembly protein PilO